MLTLINLETAAARRERMTDRLDHCGLAFERIGIDFRQRPDPEIAEWTSARFPGLAFDLDALSGAEIGCWASHLCAWRRLADAPGEATATVLEDDVVLEAGFNAAIDALSTGIEPFDVIMLGTSSRSLSWRRRRAIGPLSIHAPVGVIYNTWGYVVARHWVERFFAGGPRRLAMPIDHFLGGRADRHRPRLGVVVPHLVAEDAELASASQIEPHTFRLDRARIVETARRRLLAGPVGELVSAMSRWL
jgi:hypothetical protein